MEHPVGIIVIATTLTTVRYYGRAMKPLWGGIRNFYYHCCCHGNIMKYNGHHKCVTHADGDDSVLFIWLSLFFSVLLGLSHISKLHLISFLNKTFTFFSLLNSFYQPFSDIKIVSFLRYQSDFRHKSQSQRPKYTPISDLKKGMYPPHIYETHFLKMICLPGVNYKIKSQS